MICHVFHPLILPNTQRKSSWDAIVWMPISYNTVAFQFSHWICSKKKKNLCLRIPQLELPGLLEDAEVSCLYRKEWFVSDWWGEKVRTLVLQGPLAKRHSLPGIFSWPPAPIAAFSKKMEGSRGRKIAWPQVGKSWQQRPGEDKGKKYRNRTQPLFQESLHQWWRKNQPCAFERYEHVLQYLSEKAPI